MIPRKPVSVETSRNLYRWAKTWHRRQKEFFVDDIKLRREKQIEDFILLNEFKSVVFETDTDVFVDRAVSDDPADLIVITDQKFSRFPCRIMVEKIQERLFGCPRLYLCLNRHYINIDGSHHDPSLSHNFNLAITQWLKKSLPHCRILDLSLDYLDRGQHFTWVIPDRHYYIQYDQDN
jgi:hypothetical protein